LPSLHPLPQRQSLPASLEIMPELYLSRFIKSLYTRRDSLRGGGVTRLSVGLLNGVALLAEARDVDADANPTVLVDAGFTADRVTAQAIDAGPGS
jgi:hypothetical protein